MRKSRRARFDARTRPTTTMAGARQTRGLTRGHETKSWAVTRRSRYMQETRYNRDYTPGQASIATRHQTVGLPAALQCHAAYMPTCLLYRRGALGMAHGVLKRGSAMILRRLWDNTDSVESSIYKFVKRRLHK